MGAMCDKLRERARALRQGRWSDGAEDAALMEQAADTIWELCNKLADLIDVDLVRCGECLSWHRGYCHKHAYDVTNEYGEESTEGVFPMDEGDYCSLATRKRDADD